MSNEEKSQMTFLMLPDDLVLNCLARVSKEYYPSLSFVSKRFRSLLASTELQNLRSFLGCTGSCLYVCLRICSNYDSRTPIWFTLRQKPNSRSKILVPVSSPYSPFNYGSGVAAVNSDIYAIGGSLDNNAASNKVMVMDCRFHTWREASSMRVARDSPSTCVLNGKIHVIGGCKNLHSTNWIEVFDTKTQTWEFLQIPSKEICGGSKYKSLGYKGTVYVNCYEKNVTYKMHKGRWREAHLMFNYGICDSSTCVIENVCYRYRGGIIQWYDSNEKLWKALKGLRLPRCYLIMHSESVKLVDYGGNIALLWEEYMTDLNKVHENNYLLLLLQGKSKNNVHKKKVIWCAEIVSEKEHQGEIWGLLKWSEVVFITDGVNGLVHALATNI